MLTFFTLRRWIAPNHFRVWTLAASCLAVTSAYAQEVRVSNDSRCPVLILEAKRAADGKFEMSLRNDADSRLIAYVIRGKHNLTNTKTAVGETLEDYNGLGFAQAGGDAPGGKSAFKPKMPVSFRPLVGELIDSEFQIVYAETEDGKTFGIESDKYRALLRSQRNARREERLRLKRILQEGGLFVLVSDLENPANLFVSGPDQSLLSERREAVRVERNRLRHVLGQSGEAGLIAELNRN